MALRVGYRGPAQEFEWCKVVVGYVLFSGLGMIVVCGVGFSALKFPPCTEQLPQNWSGQGESDCLIKTKHCDCSKWALILCNFCPVL